MEKKKEMKCGGNIRSESVRSESAVSNQSELATGTSANDVLIHYIGHGLPNGKIMATAAAAVLGTHRRPIRCPPFNLLVVGCFHLPR